MRRVCVKTEVPDIPPLLCQCDSGGHNLFFKKADDDTVSNEVCAFFDWQFVFRGSPTFVTRRIFARAGNPFYDLRDSWYLTLTLKFAGKSRSIWWSATSNT